MRKGRWKLHLPHTYCTMQGQPLKGGGKPGGIAGDAKFKKRCSIWNPILMSA